MKAESLTDLSQTVGMKSYPIPSTSQNVLSVLFKWSGCAIIEPSGSTPIIYRIEGRKTNDFHQTESEKY